MLRGWRKRFASRGGGDARLGSKRLPPNGVATLPCTRPEWRWLSMPTRFAMRFRGPTRFGNRKRGWYGSRMRSFLLTLMTLIAALALTASSAQATPTNCTVYVGSGPGGVNCPVSFFGTITSNSQSTTGHAYRDDNSAVGPPSCLPSDARFEVFYTTYPGGSNIGFLFSPYGGCNVYQGSGSGGTQAYSSCLISAPPPPRSTSPSYCFTRWH